MQKAFQVATRPEPHWCLGLRLAPLQLGHIRALFRAESPLVCGGNVGLPELLHAVFICAQPWRKSERDQDKWWVGVFMRLWAVRCWRMNIADEFNKFTAYWETEMTVPETKGTSLGGGDRTVPFWMRYLVGGMTDLGLSLDECLDMRFSELSALLVLAAVSQGRVDLWTDSDQELWEHAMKN